MDLSRYLVEAHLLEGRSVAELCATHGVHRSWIYKLLARYRAEGEVGLVARSRRPDHSPNKIVDRFEDEIISLRKALSDEGYDAGAATIHYHLQQRHDHVPSVTSIWRVLRDRGFVTPQPHKRPRSSYVRFVADLPNECWQTDITHVNLADGREVEIINFIDDHSRLCVGSVARPIFTSHDVVRVFCEAATRYGFPESVLSDNGAVYTASYKGGVGAMESELMSRGILFKHSRPYHPETNGKVERFHQTMKKFLYQHDAPETVSELQSQIDTFVSYYNEVRPHRGIGRKTPRSIYEKRVKARPSREPTMVEGYRIRHDKVNPEGKVTLRYRGKLYHVGIGRPHRGRHVTLLVAGRDVRILDEHNRLIRALSIDPTRNYQALE